MITYFGNCGKEHLPNATECKHCNNDFSDGAAWRSIAKPDTGKPPGNVAGVIVSTIGRTLLGFLVWFPFMLLAMFASWGSGSSNAVGVALLLAIPILIRILRPLYREFIESDE